MNKPKNILITGASGLIGSRLTGLLVAGGNTVFHLSRSKHSSSSTPSFVWDIEEQFIDPDALHNVDTIIHLAGAGIADERWTDTRKREILESRTNATRLLFDALARQRHTVKNFISASATGYYGLNESGEVFNEASPAGSDFLARVTQQWEMEADRMKTLGLRVVKLRIGMVLSEKGGALKEIAMPVRYFVGAPLGSGNQLISWIHIDDLCGIFMKAIDDESMHGVYNAVAPNTVTNREMTRAIAKALHRPVLLPAVPSIVLKLMLGEMAEIVLKGSKVSPERILKAGFIFKFTSLDEALNDLLQLKKL